MDDATLERLARLRTVDMTTTGRRSGEPRTIEIWWFYFEGQFIVTGTPGRRDWMANVRSDPRVVIEAGDLRVEATATEISDEGFRRRFFSSTDPRWYRGQVELDRLVAEAPMIMLDFPTQ